MQAVILAAGGGGRLRPVTSTLPKGLLEVGGKPLLDYSLAALHQCGVSGIVLVIGFQGEALRRRFGFSFEGIPVSYVENDEHSITGSMYSLSKAGDVLRGPFLLLESDLLYEARVLRLVQDCPHPDVMLVTRLSGSGDEVYVSADPAGRLTWLGKVRAAGSKTDFLGEMVGISRFSDRFWANLRVKAEARYPRGRRQDSYEDCVLETAITSGPPVFALVQEDLTWIEIDTPADLERARNEVYPNIRLRGEGVAA